MKKNVMIGLMLAGAIVLSSVCTSFAMKSSIQNEIEAYAEQGTSQGAKGDTGSKGEKGEKGDTGAAGPAGKTGSTGAKGDTGAQGQQGEAGSGLVVFDAAKATTYKAGSIVLFEDVVYFVTNTPSNANNPSINRSCCKTYFSIMSEIQEAKSEAMRANQRLDNSAS